MSLAVCGLIKLSQDRFMKLFVVSSCNCSESLLVSYFLESSTG